jgi:hypothetical protein
MIIAIRITHVNGLENLENDLALRGAVWENFTFLSDCTVSKEDLSDYYNSDYACISDRGAYEDRVIYVLIINAIQ